MKKNPLVLTFDCGTQSIRALLFDKQGNIIGKAQKYFQPYYSPKAEWAEQHPEVYKDAIVEVSKSLKDKCRDVWEDIIGVTSTTIRDTCVCMDKNGEVLRPIIVWLDQREAECKEKLPLISRLAFLLVGMKETINVQRKITKSNWIIENEKEIWDKTYKYVMFSGFITHFLTGKFIDSSASQVGHVPIDYKSKKWKKTSDVQFPVFNVPKSKLCELVPPGGILGYISKEFSELTGITEGLPVIATGSDKACETLGCGVVSEDMVSLSFGTTATVQFATKKYIEPQKFLPAYPSVIADIYNPEIQIYRGYWMVSWFKKEFAEKEVMQAAELGVSAEELLNIRLKEIPAGCDGLMLQPLWAPMLKNPEGKGAIIGFNDVHTRVHIYRAIIEGIGFALIDGMRHVEKRIGTKITAATVSGGGSQSDEICQITADMFGVPVMRIQTYEACSLGSSLVAFVALNEFNSYEEAIKSMVHYKDTFIPDEKTNKIYNELSEIYRGLYWRLKPCYIKLKRITKKERK